MFHKVVKAKRSKVRVADALVDKAEALAAEAVQLVVGAKQVERQDKAVPKAASDSAAQADSADAVDLVSSLELSLGDSKRPRPARHRTHKRVRRLLVQLAMLVKALRKLPIEIGRAHV